MNMMSPQYNLFDSQKSGDLTNDDGPLYDARQLNEAASQQLGHASLPRVVMDLEGSMAGSDEDDDVDNTGLSLFYKNDDEHGDDASDMHLSFVYRPPLGGWEDEQGMVLSANPAWMQLLNPDDVTMYNEIGEGRNSYRSAGNDEEQESAGLHRRRSFLSVNSSQKSGGGGGGEEEGEGRSRRRSFMTIDSAGGSDVVAVKAGGAYFLRTHTTLMYIVSHPLSYLPILIFTVRWCLFPCRRRVCSSCISRRCCRRVSFSTIDQQHV